MGKEGPVGMGKGLGTGRSGSLKGCAVGNSGLPSMPVGLWGTTLTENTAENRELYVKTTLRELVAYIVFLVDVCLCE